MPQPTDLSQWHRHLRINKIKELFERSKIQNKRVYARVPTHFQISKFPSLSGWVETLLSVRVLWVGSLLVFWSTWTRLENTTHGLWHQLKDPDWSFQGFVSVHLQKEKTHWDQDKYGQVKTQRLGVDVKHARTFQLIASLFFLLIKVLGTCLSATEWRLDKLNNTNAHTVI